MNTARLPKSNLIIALHVIMLLLISACASSSNPRTSNPIVHNDVKSLGVMETAVFEYVKRNNNNILVVFDIDDTLLESTSFFGGDTWYNWHERKPIKHKNGGDVTIADKDRTKCIYAKLGVFYELARQKPTEADAANLVSRLQSKFSVMALTSRSPGYRSGTERELKRAGIDFSKSHLLPGFQTIAYDFNDGKSTRRVSYENGIVMSTGLNKGLVLQDLLNKVKKSYIAIFFIDDGNANITNMEAAWRNKKTFVDIYHYVGVKKIISDRNMQQSRDAIFALDAFLRIAFPDRYGAFSSDQCK